jgi:S1-C subfamily serine protease
MEDLKTIVAYAATLAAVVTLSPEPPLELPPIAGPHAAPTATAPDLPSFVLPLVSIHPIGVDYGLATGFVVDRERGYIATAAHAGIGTKFMVRLPEGVWLPATRIRTSAVADVSLLALPEGMGGLLPEAPTLAAVPGTPYPLALGGGWKGTYRGQRNIEFRPVTRLLGVLRSEVTVCAVSQDSCAELIGIVERALAENRGLSTSERHLAYNRFILLLETDESDGTVKFGMSGGPVLNFEGRPFAVISMSNGMSMLAIPIDEVTKLMR